MKYLSLLLLLLVIPASTATTERNTIDIMEWTVPWDDTRPRDPYTESANRVWFCGQQGEYLARLDPTTGEFQRYELGSGAGPHNLIVDSDGSVWFAGNLNSYIGKLNPENGDIKKYPMPDSAARDPHTLVFDDLGNIWFTVQGGNFIGRLNKASGAIDLVKVPTSGARPYGIKMDSNNVPWIVEFGSHKLATIDPETLVLREIALPREKARPRRIEIDSNDAIWYVDYANGMIGRYDQSTAQFQEWETPGGANSRPYGTAMDDQDRLWFVESGLQPNQFIGFDPSTDDFFSITPIESGGGTVRHMYYYAPAQEIWFGTDTNTIGRTKIP